MEKRRITLTKLQEKFNLSFDKVVWIVRVLERECILEHEKELAKL